MIKIKKAIDVEKDLDLLVQQKGLTYLEAVVFYFKTMSLDIEREKHRKLLSKNIIKKIKKEAIQLHYFKAKK